MPNPIYLQQVSITFHTHSEDDRDPNTVLHVFIKNRSSDTSFSENSSDYISNHLAYQRLSNAGVNERNPYLAFFENLAAGVPFPNDSTLTYFLQLRPTPIPLEEIILPVVNIHILPNGSDTWVFDYQVQFYFGDPDVPTDPNHVYDFGFSSNINGVTGIVLTQDNRNYTGIGVENQHALVPPVTTPVIDSVLTMVIVDFVTLSGAKTAGTKLNVEIDNRINASTSLSIAVAHDLSSGAELSANLFETVLTAANNLGFAAVQLQNVVLPVVNISLTPSPDQGRWRFDFRVRYYFSLGHIASAMLFESITSGVDIDQYETVYSAVYQGDSFPTVPPVKAELTKFPPVDHNTKSNIKAIPISFLSQKLEEFINSRQGLDPTSPIPALFRLRLHNTGVFGAATPANYFDLLKIDAAPPPPGHALAPGYIEGVTWDSNPTDEGQEGLKWLAGAYVNNINSKSIKLTLDATQSTPLVLAIVLDPTVESGPSQIIGTGLVGGHAIDILDLSITLKLTLNVDATRSRIDVMSWVADLQNPQNLIYTALPPTSQSLPQVQVTGTFLGEPVNFVSNSASAAFVSLLEKVLIVTLTTGGELDPGGIIRGKIRDLVYSGLITPDHFTSERVLDSINNEVNSWLLGGITWTDDHGVLPGVNNCKVVSVKPDVANDQILIGYTGPQFLFDLPTPPPAGEFAPGALTNIEHIVVLTMENRSFDHMLGYLSLPPAQAGMGRTDIDGLKGGEVNYLLDGTACYSLPFLTGETIFAPDPPHSFEPVGRAIDVGKMDGFAQAYAEEHGPAVGPNIMKYHRADNVPVFDAMARDFAICHRWFAAHPGPTFSNRFHELTGRLNIDQYGFWELSNSSTIQPVFTPTIFDYLTQANVSWKYFERSYAFLRFFEKYTFDNTHIFNFDDPGVGFLNVAATGNLPSVTFIDPHFIELPPFGDCDGPPADVAQGQLLVQKVVNAVVTSPNWSKTMLIVTYDEHGGFYDHVPPPPAVRVAPGLPATEGVRVPTFIVSPWVPGGMVFGSDSAVFDHTSILKTIAKCFLSGNPPYMGARYDAANDLSSIIGSQLRPGPFLPFIPYNFVFGASQKRLDVEGANTSPGTLLWQYDPNDTKAQMFSFEDAGGGYFYIRTHTGSLYVTADVPASSTAQTFGIKQDVKYAAGGSANPDYQRWSFAYYPGVVGSGIINATIHNAGVPDKTLHPSGQSLLSGAGVVLDTVTGGIGFGLSSPYVWEISSPLIANNSGQAGPHPPAAPVAASPGSLAFPAQQIGTESAQQVVTVTGGAQFAVTAISILDDAGAPDTEFLSVPPPGNPPPGGSVNIQNGQLVVTVWFLPTAAGARSATLRITHNEAGSPLVIPLTGTGNAALLPLLKVSTTSLFFDPKKVTTHTVTLSNAGTGPLTINSISIADSNYSFTNTCGVGPGAATLQPGQSCAVNVVCHFIGSGGTSQMLITHDAAGSPTEVDLEATSKGGGTA